MANQRGRKPILLDKNEFQKLLTELEEKNIFPNRTHLWAAVEASEWAKGRSPRPLSAQVAMMKAEELGLEIKTVKGKRGREKGQKPPMMGGRKKKVFSLEKLLAGIPKEERPGLEKTIEKARTGSLKARVKLKCLDCCNWQKGEVAECQQDDCSLWDVRPYKRRIPLEVL